MSMMKRTGARLIPCAALALALVCLLFGAVPAAAQQTDTLEVALTGAAAVPGPGDPDGSGAALLTLGEGQVCFEITVENIATPTAAHIHQGAADESGPPVVNFDIGNQGLSGCAEDVDQEVIDDIRENPSNYYVNVHNAEHPPGAVRGQLGE